MFEHLGALVEELDRLEADLPRIQAAGDRRASRDAGRRLNELKPVVDAYLEWKQVAQDVDAARELLEIVTDPAERDSWKEELADKEMQLVALEAGVKELLLPRDPNEGRNVMGMMPHPERAVEAGVGGRDGRLILGSLIDRFKSRAA